MLKLRLETKRLFLVSTSKQSIDFMVSEGQSNYYHWFGDQEITKFNSHGLFPQTENELKQFFYDCENSKNLLSFMIIEKQNNCHMGMISLQKIDWINRTAEFAVLIGEKDCWGKGYTTESCQELFKHGFMRLGLNRIWSGTSTLNIGMLKVFEKLGMKKEGIFRKSQFLNGDFEDVIEYGILREEWYGDSKN